MAKHTRRVALGRNRFVSYMEDGVLFSSFMTKEAERDNGLED